MDLINTKDILLLIAIVIMGIHAIFLYFKLFLSSSRILRHEKIYFYIWCIEVTILWLCLNSLIFPSNTSDIDSADISSRIEEISDDLSKASSELSTIQKELEARIEFVEDLKAEAEVAENMISLTDEQVNAVQTKLNQELNANSSKSLLQNILVSSVFFLLGLLIQPIYRFIKCKLAKNTNNDVKNIQVNSYSNEEIEQAIKLLDAIKHQQDAK